MADVKKEVLEAVRGAKPWGVDVVDVRITRVDYVEAITESVYRRMEASASGLPMNCARPVLRKAKKSGPMRTASVRSQSQTPTVTRRRSRAKAMPKPHGCMPRRLAKIRNSPVLSQP